MNLKPWIPFAAAATLGTTAAYVGYGLVTRQAVQVVVEKAVLDEVVVAARDVPAGTRITADDVQVLKVQPGTMPAQGLVANLADVAGKVTTTSLRAGQPVATGAVADSAATGLASLVPAGHRAIVVEMNRSAGVLEFVVPEARVDVVSSFRDGDVLAVRTVAQNLRVLAVSGRVDGETVPEPEADGGGGPPPPPRQGNAPVGDASATIGVTLMVTPEQAAAIELASVGGKPRLTLRGAGDGELSDFEELTLADLRGSREPINPAGASDAADSWERYAEATPVQWQPPVVPAVEAVEQVSAETPSTKPAAEPAAPPPVAAQPRPHVVEVIRGGVLSREAVPSAPAGHARPAATSLPKADAPAAPATRPIYDSVYVGADTSPAAE